MTTLDSLYGTYHCPDCGRYVKPPYCLFCGAEIRKRPMLKEVVERSKASSKRSEK